MLCYSCLNKELFVFDALLFLKRAVCVKCFDIIDLI
jgi:hypothetical protein